VLLAGLALAGILYARQNRRRAVARRGGNTPKVEHAQRTKKGLDPEFWKQLKYLLKIVLPSWKSKEFLILLLHTSFLVLRTYLSIVVAQLDGEIVKTIVAKSPRAFAWSVVKWLGLGVPATYTNSMIRYLESKLAIAFRTRLVEYSYGRYCEDETYYRVGNLDSRLANADQCLTEDISKFCSLLAHLHSQLSKPMLDVVLMSAKLWSLGSERDPNPANRIILIALASFVIYTTAKVLRFVSPPFGKMAAEQAKREGELRFVHSRMITNSEEIAFYGGHKIEQSILERTYYSLVKHMNKIFKTRIFYVAVEGFFMKYVWSSTGLIMVALPTFIAKEKSESELIAEDSSLVEETSNRTQTFITARKLLVDAADAIERMMSSYKEITELAGYTSRVYEMIEVFNDMRVHRYQKNVSDASNQNRLLAGSGTINEGDTIMLKQVPIVTPNGDVLVQSMNLECAPGMHLLITGPNGCGKSSLFRIIGGLWPIYGGTLTKPHAKQLFYIPQRPYLPIGSLREQVIYPDSTDDMRAKGYTDDFLMEIMGHAHLQHIVSREGGWDAVNDWADVLSGGEKQRVGMARLFYHQPKYAILDECTSAVSIDVEGKMYMHAIEIGVTLITVTHRPSLWKYHKFLLQFDGEGGYRFSALNAEARLSLKEEKVKLEKDLTGVPKKQKRLRELCRLLGEESEPLQRSLNASQVLDESVEQVDPAEQ
jgi:ATP-binding cassette subfamily D (ALD) protein 2